MNFLKRLFNKEKRIEVGYGYFPYRNTWCTVYLMRSTGQFYFEWDDLFDEGRRVNFPKEPLSSNLFFKSKGATMDEYNRAFKLHEAK